MINSRDVHRVRVEIRRADVKCILGSDHEMIARQSDHVVELAERHALWGEPRAHSRPVYNGMPISASREYWGGGGGGSM